jgi:hypothetical protein
VIRAAVADGVATADVGDASSDSHLAQLVQDSMWQPVYAEGG